MSKNRVCKLIAFLLLSLITLSACSGNTTQGGGTAPAAASTTAAAANTASAPSAAAPAEASGELTYEGEAYTRNDRGFPQLNGVNLSIWMPMEKEYVDVVSNYTEMEIVKNFMDALDVRFTFSHPALGQEKENFAIMIASDTLPDIIFSGGIDSYYPGGVTMAYEDGLLFDYTDLINDANTPNFMALVMNDPYMSKGAADDSGRIIRLGACLTGSEESCTTMFGLMGRKDMLEATGLDKPVTYDDWYEMLTAMKENGVEYPLIFNKGNYWQSRNAFSAGYGLPANSFGVSTDGKAIYGPYEDNFKDYLAMLNKWYSEGLINPDFMNQETAQTWSMFADDMGAVTAEHLWGYNPNYYVAVELDNPEKAMVALDYPVLKAGDKIRNMVTNRGMTHLKYITVDCETPFAAVLMLDALYDTEIEFMMSNGIVDLGYTLNDMGYPEITTITADTTNEVLRNSRIHPFETESDSDLDYIVTSKYCFGVQPDCIREMIKHSYDGTWPTYAIKFTPAESDVLSKHMTDITTYREEMILKFVTGNESIDNFEAYQQRLRDLGIESILEAYQAAYDRYLAR